MPVITQKEQKEMLSTNNFEAKEDQTIKTVKQKQEKKESSNGIFVVFKKDYEKISSFDLYVEYGKKIKCEYGKVTTTETEIYRQLLDMGFVEV